MTLEEELTEEFMEYNVEWKDDVELAHFCAKEPTELDIRFFIEESYGIHPISKHPMDRTAGILCSRAMSQINYPEFLRLVLLQWREL